MKLSLQEKLSTLKELDSEVADLVKEEVVNEIEQADAYKEDIYDTIAKLEQLSLKTSTTAPAATVLPSRDPASESKVRLPKLMIQPFRGELTTWTIDHSPTSKNLITSVLCLPLMPLLSSHSQMPTTTKPFKCSPVDLETNSSSLIDTWTYC